MIQFWVIKRSLKWCFLRSQSEQNELRLSSITEGLKTQNTTNYIKLAIVTHYFHFSAILCRVCSMINRSVNSMLIR